MIDTIHFRIHDLDQHIRLIEHLDRSSEAEGFSKWKDYITEENYIPVHEKVYIRGVGRDEKTRKTIKTGYSNFLDSYHYNINYYINYEADWIDFNVSVTKYFLGTNVFMLYPNIMEAGYTDYQAYNSRQYLYSGFDILKKFFREFINRKLNNLAKTELIQISRIDLCFNKTFSTKEYAFQYLIDLKRVKKKYLRKHATSINNYNTGVYFPTRDYTLKIYHKGSEFRQHDKKQLLKINKKLGFNYFDIKTIQDYSDRIVRYEVEFRNGMLNHLYKKYVFGKDEPLLQKHKRKFEKIYGNNGWLVETDEEGNKTKTSFINLTRREKHSYKWFKNIQEKSFDFYIKRFGETQEDINYIEELETEQKTFIPQNVFSRRLYNTLCNQFFRFVKEFEVKNFKDVEYLLNSKDQKVIKDKVILNLPDEHSKDDLQRFSVSTMRYYFYFLTEMNFQEIISSGLFKERTAYRYRKIAKALGFSDVLSKKPIHYSFNSLQEYRIFLNQNWEKLKSLHKFTLNGKKITRSLS